MSSRKPRKPRIYPGFPTYEIEYAESERSRRVEKIMMAVFYAYMTVCFAGTALIFARAILERLVV